jgi:2-C-methyl-D-erythritol 4-phosphate cytidylyltransferase
VVIVHDAARPLARPELIDRVLGGLVEADGSVPGIPVTDTVKRIAGGLVVETLDRSQLVAVQTPQAFLAEALRQAYAQPQRSADATDCAALLERIGLPVAVVEGDPGNVKVTVPADLERAERALAS